MRARTTARPGSPDRPRAAARTTDLCFSFLTSSENPRTLGRWMPLCVDLPMAHVREFQQRFRFLLWLNSNSAFLIFVCVCACTLLAKEPRYPPWGGGAGPALRASRPRRPPTDGSFSRTRVRGSTPENAQAPFAYLAKSPTCT